MVIKVPPVVDYPVKPQYGWGGYYHKKDPTLLPANVLTGGTFNCFVPDNDVIVTRAGSLVLGQQATLNNPIIGHRKKFTNSEGIDYEVRVWNSGNTTQKDVFQVLYQSRNLEYTLISGTFVANEIITGSVSTATALVVSVVSSNVLILQNIEGTFQAGETITGTTSGATGTIIVPPIFQWWNISQNTNPIPAAVSRLGMDAHWYFDEWFDTSTDGSQSLRLSRLIGANGTNKIISWTGGVAQITSLVTNTSISIDPSKTWAQLGFIDPANGGTGVVVVNGVAFTASAGWATNTLSVSSTSGISINDLAFDQIQIKTAPIVFDFPRTVQNHVIYGNFQSRTLYVSNAFNHPAFQSISAAQAVQNDLVLSGSYTSTGSHIYRVTIDSVFIAVNDQTYTSGGPNGQNDGIFNTSGYSAGPTTIPNVYTILIVADYLVNPTSPVGAFNIGDTVYCLDADGSSNIASGIIIANAVPVPGGSLAVRLQNGTGFLGGAILTSTGGGSALNSGSFFNDFFQYSKNGIVVPLNASGIGSCDVNRVFTTIALTDGLVFQFANFIGHAIGDSFQLSINQGGIDTFQWQIDGATPVATHVAITGAAQTLANGIVITFVNSTGHTLGDYWDISVNQAITDAYINFYFTLPARFPGEGAFVYIPSNFWTMAVQEDVMYVNSQHGQWSYLEFKLSADLLSETIVLTPLKSESSNKVIWPYMIGYLDNNLVYVTENKTLDMIGRKKFVELPQIGNLSDPVKLDFQFASFVNGSFEFYDKKLWINSAKDGIMFCFDWIKKYWQPPQVVPENGILSTYQNSLISHSNLRNVTNTLFVGTNDNGSAFDVKMRFPYNSYGVRWEKKISNMTFIEGYMIGSPEINYNILFEPNGCKGILNHTVNPILCIPADRASLGKSALGAHGLGNDPQTPSNYFQEIYKWPSRDFYFAAIELTCQSLDQQWGILSVGLNTNLSDRGNNLLTSNTILIP